MACLHLPPQALFPKYNIDPHNVIKCISPLPSPPPAQLLCPVDLPAPALALAHELGLLALHRYRRVRNQAAPLVELVCKRWV